MRSGPPSPRALTEAHTHTASLPEFILESKGLNKGSENKYPQRRGSGVRELRGSAGGRRHEAEVGPGSSRPAQPLPGRRAWEPECRARLGAARRARTGSQAVSWHRQLSMWV